MDSLITDFLAKIRVGSPKPSWTYSFAVNDTCQERDFLYAILNYGSTWEVHSKDSSGTRYRFPSTWVTP